MGQTLRSAVDAADPYVGDNAAATRLTMAKEADPAIAGLLDVLNASKKSDLVKLCRGLTITSHALASIIAAGMSGLLYPYEYFRVHREISDPALQPSEEEHQALAKSEIGNPLEPEAQKFMRKIHQTFKQRILLNAHFFVCPSRWHLIYFSQRDTDRYNPHWEHGSHIHLLNWVTHPLLTPDVVYEELHRDKPKLKGALHIRYAGREYKHDGRSRRSAQSRKPE